MLRRNEVAVLIPSLVIPSEVEESLIIVRPLLRSETSRDVSTPLDMTKR